MSIYFIIGTSVLIQLITVFVALRLIKVTGGITAWIFISAALAFMAIRRIFSLLEALADRSSYNPDFSFELLGLVTSLLMLAGVILISPLFKTVKQSGEKYRRLVRELQDTLAELRMSEKKLTDITAHLGEGVYVFDRNGTVTFLNPTAERLLGWTIDELNEKGAHDLFHCRKADGTVLHREECNILKVIHTGETFSSNNEFFMKKDGDIFPVSVISNAIKDKDGISGAVISFRDITERKRAEEALAEEISMRTLGADIGEALTKGNVLFEMLQTCCEAMVRDLDVAFARIWTLNEKENVLELKASAGIYTHTDGQHSRIPVGKYKIGLIAREGKPHLTNNVMDDPRIQDLEWARREGIVSFAGHPLIVEERVVGVMGMFSRKPLPEITLKALSSVADEIAIGIDRKNAEEAVRKAYVDLEFRIQERTAELSHLNKVLEKEKRHIKITNKLLKLFVQKISRKKYLDAAVNLLQEWSGCRCLGIRILDEKGHIPYESYVGFSQTFLDSENLLSVERDHCACISVIAGDTGPRDLSVMTQYGSFYTDNIFKYLNSLTEPERTRFRSGCVQNGFKSVAVIPVRYQEKMLGAIHLADEREGMTSFNEVVFAETLANVIGESIYKFNAEDNLKKSQDQLRNLTAYLQEVRENERTIIAREIHDELGQIMTALKIDLSWMQDKYNDHKTLNEKTKSMLSLIDATIQTVKKIITDLRPGILDHLGISAAIEWQAEEFQRITGIPCAVAIIPEEILLNKDLTTNIFRIFQEILTNAMRHAQATHINVRLEEIDGRVLLNVRDNGSGITEEQIYHPSSFGIMGIRERVNFLGGSFKITGTPREGTEISIIVPLEDHKKDYSA
jgi:PAS domain S-box-containing protein